MSDCCKCCKNYSARRFPDELTVDDTILALEAALTGKPVGSVVVSWFGSLIEDTGGTVVGFEFCGWMFDPWASHRYYVHLCPY